MINRDWLYVGAVVTRKSYFGLFSVERIGCIDGWVWVKKGPYKWFVSVLELGRYNGEPIDDIGNQDIETPEDCRLLLPDLERKVRNDFYRHKNYNNNYKKEPEVKPFENEFKEIALQKKEMIRITRPVHTRRYVDEWLYD